MVGGLGAVMRHRVEVATQGHALLRAHTDTNGGICEWGALGRRLDYDLQ